uniref:FBD domain-containing protein n=1 Tax=Timema cristinae TaxID=61476 RepID=A0A7R9H1Y2_TIMCR|nr:unnamed protein product [Timema cristinae]
MVSLEMIKMDRREVVRLLVALGEACGHTLRRVYLWGAFAHDQNPFLEDNTPDRYRGLGAFKMRMTSRCQYLDVWSKLSSLTVLALNYGYLSDQRGNVLLVLASVLNGRLATLQLLCLEDEIPNKYGGHAIPDRAWKTVLESCPGLQVHLVVDSMAEHSMVRSFISPSIPVHQFALFSGIQLERKRQWDMDVTFRVLEKWYSDRLEVVLVHLYRNNEFLDRTLVKLLTALPRLTCLELIGIIRDVDNVEKMCEILSRESLKLEKLRVCVQDGSNEGLKQKIEDIQSLYMEKLLNKGVKIDLTTYKL